MGCPHYIIRLGSYWWTVLLFQAQCRLSNRRGVLSSHRLPAEGHQVRLLQQKAHPPLLHFYTPRQTTSLLTWHNKTWLIDWLKSKKANHLLLFPLFSQIFTFIGSGQRLEGMQGSPKGYNNYKPQCVSQERVKCEVVPQEGAKESAGHLPHWHDPDKISHPHQSSPALIHI